MQIIIEIKFIGYLKFKMGYEVMSLLTDQDSEIEQVLDKIFIGNESKHSFGGHIVFLNGVAASEKTFLNEGDIITIAPNMLGG